MISPQEILIKICILIIINTLSLPPESAVGAVPSSTKLTWFAIHKEGIGVWETHGTCAFKRAVSTTIRTNTEVSVPFLTLGLDLFD